MRVNPMDPHATPDQLTDRIRRTQARQQRSLAAIHRSEAALAHATELLESARVAIAQARMRRSCMPKTIRQLREERGESTMQLADALGTTLQDLHDLESGVASPSVERLWWLARHFGVRQEDINLEPQRSPTVGEKVRDALTE